MAVMLEGLRRKGEELDPEEGERKARLEQLEQSLPHIKGTERKGLTPEERAMLHKYLAMRLCHLPHSWLQFISSLRWLLADSLNHLLHFLLASKLDKMLNSGRVAYLISVIEVSDPLVQPDI